VRRDLAASIVLILSKYGFMDYAENIHGGAAAHERFHLRARAGERPLICLFIMNLYGGGAERVVVELANELVQQKYDVDLVVVNRTGPLASHLRPEVNLCSLEQKRTISSIGKFRSYLKRRRPDIVFSHLTHINIASILARLFLKNRPELVVIEHSHFSSELKAAKGLVRVAYMLVPFLYRFADRVAAVSDDMRNSIARFALLPRERVSVLHNPVVSPKIYQRASEQPEHPWLPPSEVPVILAAGRLVRQKNFPLLIRAFATLQKKRRARLIILGDGELRPELMSLAQELGLADVLDLPGFHENPYAFMRSASVFALSSDWEGLPGVLIEALACGCPIVATDCETGPREILCDGKFGRLVSPGDDRALANALEAALDEPGAASERVVRAEHFGVTAAVERYLELASALRLSKRSTMNKRKREASPAQS
jgi:glycosyltransferase involved in cell wall biosynthesis